MSNNSIAEAGKVQLGDELDRLVAAGTLTPEQAMETAQQRGLTTGTGGYEPVGWANEETALLNERSRQSVAQSKAYQASRVVNPAGYDAGSQLAFNVAHPLSEF